jgi:hypothetical protein
MDTKDRNTRTSANCIIHFKALFGHEIRRIDSASRGGVNKRESTASKPGKIVRPSTVYQGSLHKAKSILYFAFSLLDK